MKRARLVAAVTLLILLTGYIWSSPYRTIVKIGDAVSEKDPEKLGENIDFLLLRQNLKAQVNASIMKGATTESKDNPFSAMGKMIGSKMVDSVVDTIVTPETIIRFVNSYGQFQINDSGSIGLVGKVIAVWKKGRSRYGSFSTFSYWLPTDNGDLQLVLSRSGFGWKLTNAILPVEELDKHVQGAKKSSSQPPRKGKE